MRRLFVICLLISLSATAATPDNKPADCSSRQLASTELLVGEQILVPVEYHGQRLWMALDLGSPFSVLWPSAVETLHLRTETLDNRDGFKVKICGECVVMCPATLPPGVHPKRDRAASIGVIAVESEGVQSCLPS